MFGLTTLYSKVKYWLTDWDLCDCDCAHISVWTCAQHGVSSASVNTLSVWNTQMCLKWVCVCVCLFLGCSGGEKTNTQLLKCKNWHTHTHTKHLLLSSLLHGAILSSGDICGRKSFRLFSPAALDVLTLFMADTRTLGPDLPFKLTESVGDWLD